MPNQNPHISTTKRPPVVVVLGHVDHGKTTLLDTIRKSNVADREAGGITQSMGAYEISHTATDSKDVSRITFIDTPGHEAFSKMRRRGISVADIAILVVAVDDGVQPQTKEAIKIIQESKIPFVVAINKIDKSGVNIDRVKEALLTEGVLLEGFGGDISFQPISAKTGEGIPELLDVILLTADVNELTADLTLPGEGIIIEAKLDGRKGITATGIVKNGTLRIGEKISAGNARGKIKGLEDFLGTRIESAIPSSPVLMYGFESIPEIGEKFVSGSAANITTPTSAPQKNTPTAPLKKETNVLHLILKADVAGSLESLQEIIARMKLPTGAKIKIIASSIGDITDGDVKHALSVGGMVVGFRVKMGKAAANVAESHRVNVVMSDIVYDLEKSLIEQLIGSPGGITKGDLEVLAVFGVKSVKEQIVGGKVIDGSIVNGGGVKTMRAGAVIGKAKITSLQSQKKNTPRVEQGSEAGLLLDGDVLVKAGDHLVVND